MVEPQPQSSYPPPEKLPQTQEHVPAPEAQVKESKAFEESSRAPSSSQSPGPQPSRVEAPDSGVISKERQQHEHSPQEKAEYLKREEVHTMAKDLAQLREEEARKEQRKIAQLESEKETAREKETVQKIREMALERKRRGEEEQQKVFQKIRESILPSSEESPFQNLPSPPSAFQKIAIRFLIVVLLGFIAFNVALFGYWYFFQKSEVPSPAPVAQQTPGETPTGSPIQPPAVEPPLSPEPPQPPPLPILPSQLQNLIDPAHKTVIHFTNREEIPRFLSRSFPREFQGFTEIVLRKKPELYAHEGVSILELFGVSIPSSISSQFKEESLFFFYSYAGKNRPGVVVQIKDAKAVQEMFKSWEASLEQDLVSLSPLWGTTGTWYTHSFRSKPYKNVDIYFQTFSLQDIGIVYAVVGDHLIFASSFEAAKAAIDRFVAPSFNLQIETPEEKMLRQKIGQLFLIGFEGTTLTPDVEQLIERLLPGGVLLLSHNIKDAPQLRLLIEELQTASLWHSSSPLFIAVDQEGGSISRVQFGQERTPQAFIATDGQAYQIGKERGQELKELGINLNLAPVLDSAQSSDFVFARTFQKEHPRAGYLARYVVAGQKDAGILSAVKHFPGYGSIAFDPEKKLAVVAELPDLDPFRVALSAYPEFLLLSNVIYPLLHPGKPFSFSEEGIALIRSELGFEGILLSDDLSQPALLKNYSRKDIVLSPLEAGVNMLLFSQAKEAQKAQEILLKEIQKNSELRGMVEGSVARLLSLKEQFFAPSESYVALTIDNK